MCVPAARFGKELLKTVDFDLEYARNVIRAEAEAIASMTPIVDAPFAQAAEMLYECRGSCIVTGIGKAGIIGRKISATLASTGTPSHFLHPAEAVHGDLGRLRKSDIVIVLSYGGETDEVTRLINLVKHLQIRLIAITGESDSTLSRYIGDALAFTVMKARHFSVEDYVRFHPGGSLGAQLMTVEQSMMFRPGEKLPLVGLDETVRDMLAATSELKRHGAVMVVDSEGKLAGIITDGDLRRLLTREAAAVLDLKAGDIMTPGCKRIRADALASEAWWTRRIGPSG